MSHKAIKLSIINLGFKENTYDPDLISEFQEKLKKYCFDEYRVILEFMNESGGFLMDENDFSGLCLKKKCDEHCTKYTHINNVLDFYFSDIDIFLYCSFHSFFSPLLKTSSVIIRKEDLNNVLCENLKISNATLKKIADKISKKYLIEEKTKKFKKTTEEEKYKKYVKSIKITEDETDVILKNEIFHIVKNFNCIVAGGFVLYIEGITKEFGDIDVFVNLKESFDNIKNYIENKFKIKATKTYHFENYKNICNICEIENFKIYIDGNLVDIQLIRTSKEYEDLVDDFDLPFVRLYLKFDNNDLLLHFTKSFCYINDFESKKFLHSEKSLERYNKYVSRI